MTREYLFTFEDICIATPGRWQNSSTSPEETISAVITDSRGDCSGAMFLALRGEIFDGHKFIEKALESGAKYGHRQHIRDKG